MAQIKIYPATQAQARNILTVVNEINRKLSPPIDPSDIALVLWDWDGTKLAEYSSQDVTALTELPVPDVLPPYAPADHELLLFQSWNWSLADIKAWLQTHEGETLDVGAIYTTTDGLNHNYWGNPRLSAGTAINAQKRGSASIGNNALYNCYSLKQINIPNGVASIGTYAFYNCYALSQLNVPHGVTSIGGNAFQNCHSLTRIILPDGVTSIGGNAFQNCHALTQINLPDGVTDIGSNAFYDCHSAAQINIPNGVTSIGTYAFYYCYALSQISIPGSVTSIGTNAFQNCRILCDILNESQAALSDANAFSGLSSNYRIYVPRANLSWFETATNWATIYTQGHIVAIEDYIEYLESIGFNVDAYKGA